MTIKEGNKFSPDTEPIGQINPREGGEISDIGKRNRYRVTGQGEENGVLGFFVLRVEADDPKTKTGVELFFANDKKVRVREGSA